MRYDGGDLAWAILVCLPVWALIGFVAYWITKPRPKRSYIARPDGYGLTSNTSQTALELACEESRRRSRARRSGPQSIEPSSAGYIAERNDWYGV